MRLLYFQTLSLPHPCRDSEQQVLGFQTTKELLYGGFWQKEHSSIPPPSSSPSSSPLTKSHMFSISLLLDASVSRFSSLTHCVRAVRGVWPPEVETTPIDSRAHFIKHFYYEVCCPLHHYYIMMNLSPLHHYYILVNLSPLHRYYIMMNLSPLHHYYSMMNLSPLHHYYIMMNLSPLHHYYIMMNLYHLSL